MTQEEIVENLEQFAIQKNIPFYSCFNQKFNIPNLARRYIGTFRSIINTCVLAINIVSCKEINPDIIEL